MAAKVRIRRKRFKSRKTGNCSAHVFNSTFEERHCITYLSNLIRSRFISRKADGIFDLALAVIGEKTVLNIIRKKYPGVVEEVALEEYVERENLSGVIPVWAMKRMLRHEISDILDRRLSRLRKAGESETEKRLKVLMKVFDLKEEEIAILTFFYLLQSSSILDNYLARDEIADFSELPVFRSHGHLLLGIQRSAFVRGLYKGNLWRSGIFDERFSSSYELSNWLVHYLSGMGQRDISHEFFHKTNDERLHPSDFDISPDELSIVKALIRGNGAMNILLYGMPGTGKTSFARSITRAMGKELLTVRIPEEDDIDERKKWIFAAINLADRKRSVVLVDEADELLNSVNSLFSRSKSGKSWINNLLDTHDKKVIWITNRTSEIDPSTKRRFDFSLEFRKLNVKNRMKVLRYALRAKNLENYFTDEELHELCTEYSVNADGIVSAINMLRINRRSAKKTALMKIRTVLKNHEKICGGRSAESTRLPGKEYTLGGLNTSYDLKKLRKAAENYLGRLGTSTRKRIPPFSVLLYGMPGTGKTEFVNYLGQRLGREVLLRRASDIQSPYVGVTEMNIASAFREAQDREQILFFDEADTFLFPRSMAHWSWEKSFTNEILTQLEYYRGIVIFSTNDIKGLDEAALRRFKFKIEFMPLAPDGNVHFYNTLLLPLTNDGKIPDRVEGRLRCIYPLTPGDFVVVRDKYAFADLDDVSHQQLLQDLEDEVRLKRDKKVIAGFSA